MAEPAPSGSHPSPAPMSPAPLLAVVQKFKRSQLQPGKKRFAVEALHPHSARVRSTCII